MLKQRMIDYLIKHCYMINVIAGHRKKIALYKNSLSDDYYKEKSRKDFALKEIEELENRLSDINSQEALMSQEFYRYISRFDSSTYHKCLMLLYLDEILLKNLIKSGKSSDEMIVFLQGVYTEIIDEKIIPDMPVQNFSHAYFNNLSEKITMKGDSK